APARRRSPLPDGFDRAVVAAPRPHVDRGSRAAARPARPLPGPGDPQAAHRAASAAGALALAADTGLRRTHHRARAPRRPHRAPPVRRTAQGVPPSARNAVGARAVTVRPHKLLTYASASATALPQVLVSAGPPRSRVRSFGSASTFSIALTMAAAASASPRCSSIIAPDQIWPIGLAMPSPAISGAEPCTGSNMDGNLRSGLMLPDGAMPMVPVQAGPRSERMSPNRFEPTTTLKRSGLSTNNAARMSMWYLSHLISGEFFAMASTRSSQYGMVMAMPF